MEFVEPEDEPQPFRRPLPPDDRVWRHPSEMGPVRPPVRRQLWVVGLTAAVAASLLSTGLVVVAGALLDPGPGHAGASPSRATLLSQPSGNGGAKGDVVGIAARIRPAMALVKVDQGRSTGSGVIVRSDGHVLTNAHVLDGATSVTVVLANGREVPARVVGSDPDIDAAVLKIDGGPFPVAPLGTAANLKVGQQAIAIGSPLVLSGGQPVSVGTINGLHRSVRTANSRVLMDMVQTDTPISAGSSGGALVDAAGQVVGITTALAAGDASTKGFGFATPIDVAAWAADQLITTGKVTSVWLGVEGSDLDDAAAVDLDVDGGAMVDKVKADSPAEQAGLVPHDVIVSLDGRPVTSLGVLVMAVHTHRPGDVVTLDVVRDHQHRGMKATVAERPPGS
jgi:S1-C subfamily serine protease